MKTETPHEILSRYWEDLNLDYNETTLIIKAMEEYANQFNPESKEPLKPLSEITDEQIINEAVDICTENQVTCNYEDLSEFGKANCDLVIQGIRKGLSLNAKGYELPVYFSPVQVKDGFEKFLEEGEQQHDNMIAMHPDEPDTKRTHAFMAQTYRYILSEYQKFAPVSEVKEQTPLVSDEEIEKQILYEINGAGSGYTEAYSAGFNSAVKWMQRLFKHNQKL